MIEYRTWEKVVARALDYYIGRTDEDEPKVPILTMRQARKGLYLRMLLQFVNWITCFFIIAGVLRHWG
ncbi:MAG: hypothetical protein CBC12_01610 [Candidatus Puniceispirillum sp. TMED52]|nr:MAG: hypothetical protein CBC12_01610 [Candidatus Puniceispirillum sp. TMED52]